MSLATQLPTVAEFESSPLVHRFGDLFAPPGLTNFLGAVQADNDLFGIRSVTFPPFSTGCWTVTANAYVAGRLLVSYGVPVTFRWRPDRVVRTATVDGLEITTTMVLAPREMAVVMDVAVRSTDGSAREVPLELVISSSLTRAVRPWNAAEPPAETDNVTTVDSPRRAVGSAARGSEAYSLQGVDVPADVTPRGVRLTMEVPRDGAWRCGFVYAVGESVAAAAATYDTLIADVPAAVQAAERVWDDEIAAMFTPGNDRFGGHLPVLETTNPALRRLYLTGALGVLYFRRDSPYSVLGRTYDTLMPRYWQSVTFLWDYNLSSLVHALLDPHVMRRHLEHWMATDVHSHFGTEWLTGAPVGNWYAVNDFAMTRMIRDYVSWTGDAGWLTHQVGDAGRTVADYVDEFATAWRSRRSPRGLADYGDIDNLLECVSTYIHEVASLNAANVFCLRAAADMDVHLRDGAAAPAYRDEAAQLAAGVQELYVRVQGYWQTRFPDASLVPVRHCYDFFTVPFGMLEDLDDEQRSEMVDFFVRELQTPTWMHALSPYDDDAVFSVRPDHQWNGAYPAWPAESAAALIRMGRDDLVAQWLPGLAASANQGPFGQAHFAEAAVDPDAGGARKAPPEMPWINDWTCSSNGAWVGLVIEAMFGVRVGWDGSISATPRLQHIDPEARLRNLRIGGVSYDVDAHGIQPA